MYVDLYCEVALYFFLRLSCIHRPLKGIVFAVSWHPKGGELMFPIEHESSSSSRDAGKPVDSIRLVPSYVKISNLTHFPGVYTMY